METGRGGEVGWRQYLLSNNKHRKAAATYLNLSRVLIAGCGMKVVDRSVHIHRVYMSLLGVYFLV